MRDTGGFVSRASLEDAPREVTDAASLLAPLPGVHVRRMGADDSFATLSIRGSTSTEVAILLGGVPLTGGADPSLDLASLPLWPGARVQVYRSFAPGVLGPGSLGGTLVIEPPAPSAPIGAEVWGAVGSYGEARLRVSDVRGLGGEGKGGRIVTALSASRADNGFTYFDPTASTPGHDIYAMRQNAGHASLNGLTSLALPVPTAAGEGTLRVLALVQARRQGNPGTVLQPTVAETLDSNRELASVELTLPTHDGEWGVRGWGRRDDLRLRDPYATPALGAAHTNDTIVAAGGGARWLRRWGELASLEAALDGSAERYAPADWVGAPLPPGATRALGGVALDGDWRPARGLRLIASGRGEGWSDSSQDPSIPGHTEFEPTGHLGAEVQLGPGLLAAHGGALARPPSFVERYGDRGAFLGDPNLRPESAWTVDLGGKVASAAGGPVRARLEVAGFATWATDLIVFVPEGAYGRAQATNIGQARLFGVEVEGAARAWGWELRVAYTGMATENGAECAATSGALSPTPACDRPALPGRPANDLVADLAYTLGPARARVGVDAVSGMIADRVGTVVVPPRVLGSAGLRVDVPGVKGLRVAADFRNVFDQRTSEYAGVLGPVREPIGDAFEYPLPGRTFLVSMRWAGGNEP
ncbi:MAG TPA: TonB-dependent receptor [Polyangiaceae bacterium]